MRTNRQQSQNPICKSVKKIHNPCRIHCWSHWSRKYNKHAYADLYIMLIIIYFVNKTPGGSGGWVWVWVCVCVCVWGGGGGGGGLVRFKNTYELLNQRALKFHL